MGKGNREHESGKGKEEKRGIKVNGRNRRGSENGERYRDCKIEKGKKQNSNQ